MYFLKPKKGVKISWGSTSVWYIIIYLRSCYLYIQQSLEDGKVCYMSLSRCYLCGKVDITLYKSLILGSSS